MPASRRDCTPAFDPAHPSWEAREALAHSKGLQARLQAERDRWCHTHRSPAAWQEAHHPTERVVLLGDSREAEKVRRRRVDARLWRALDPDQERALTTLGECAERLLRPVSTRVSAYDGMPVTHRAHTGTPLETVNPRQRAHWVAWVERCQAQGIAHDVVVALMVRGESLSMMDRAQARRKGWARRELFRALNAYCHVRGWKAA